MSTEAKYLELLKAARKVREAQKNYFRLRTHDALNESKKLEKQLDDLIKPEDPSTQLFLL